MLHTYAVHFTIHASQPTCSFAIDILCTVSDTNQDEALKQARHELDQILGTYVPETQTRQLDYIIPLTLENNHD